MCSKLLHTAGHITTHRTLPRGLVRAVIRHLTLGLFPVMPAARLPCYWALFGFFRLFFGGLFRGVFEAGAQVCDGGYMYITAKVYENTNLHTHRHTDTHTHTPEEAYFYAKRGRFLCQKGPISMPKEAECYAPSCYERVNVIHVVMSLVGIVEYRDLRLCMCVCLCVCV